MTPENPSSVLSRIVVPVTAAALRWCLYAGALYGMFLFVFAALMPASSESSTPPPPGNDSRVAAVWRFDRAVFRRLSAHVVAAEGDQKWSADEGALFWSRRPDDLNDPWAQAQAARAQDALAPGAHPDASHGATHPESRPASLHEALQESRLLPKVTHSLFEVGWLLLKSLALLLAWAGSAAGLRYWRESQAPGGVAALPVAVTFLVAVPVLVVTADAALQLDLGTQLSPLLQPIFVAAFSAAGSRLAGRQLAESKSTVQFFKAFAPWRSLLLAVRLGVAESCQTLLPFVPAAAVAAVFIDSKADLSLRAADNGLSILVIHLVQSAQVQDRVFHGGVLVATFLALVAVGRQFLVEARRALLPIGGST